MAAALGCVGIFSNIKLTVLNISLFNGSLLCTNSCSKLLAIAMSEAFKPCCIIVTASLIFSFTGAKYFSQAANFEARAICFASCSISSKKVSVANSFSIIHSLIFLLQSQFLSHSKRSIGLYLSWEPLVECP